MRPLVIILLLVLAVACDSAAATVDRGFDLAVASPTNTIGDDLTEQDATAPVAQATVMGPVPRGEERGQVIDGFCPDEVEPVTVRTRHHPEQTDVWELRATAHHGRIVLEWGEPAVPGVTGYVVARHSRDSYGDLVKGSIRIFDVDGISGGRFVDSNDVDPRTPYTYRVFPVTADGLGVPTVPLKVWSLPAVRPLAPVNASASYHAVVGTWQIGANHDFNAIDHEFVGGWRIGANHVFLEPVSGIRVLRRESGEANWQLVHDDISEYQDHNSFFPGLGYDSWEDVDTDPNTDYEYAICFGNAAGVGRAAVLDAIREPDTEVVQVGPPRDFRAHPDPVTVHWTPLSDPRVVGYELEREPVSEDDVYDLHFTTSDRAENYVTIYGGVRNISETKFRVRAVTDDGHGLWSERIAADIADAEGQRDPMPKPEVVTLAAAHNQVLMVWGTEDSLDGLKVRYLRRQSGIDDEFRVLVYWDWIDLDEFDWARAYPVESVGFTDEYDVRPDTEYEYAVQVKRGDVVSPMSDPVSVRTRVNPKHAERRPLPVYDLESRPTSEGVLLTWELPDDPTLKGILLWESEQNHDAIGIGPPVLLPPDQTSYLALTRGFQPEPLVYGHEVETFNDYGTQAVGSQRTPAYAPEMLHCRATTEEVTRANPGHHLTIRFRACEETQTQVIRRELTADGFKESKFEQRCAWGPSAPVIRGGFDYFEGTQKCDYHDYFVKPGTWYIYELTQTFADGRTFTSHHEVVTRAW